MKEVKSVPLDYARGKKGKGESQITSHPELVSGSIKMPKPIRHDKHGILTFIVAVFMILVGLLYFNDVFAACDPGTSPPRADLLVTSPALSGKFYSKTLVCIVNTNASDVSFDTQADYNSLKTDYFTRSNFTKTEVSGTSLTLQNEHIYHSANDLSLSSVSGSGIALVFVDGNLEITSNILYGKADLASGLVFIVKGDVYIRDTVTEVNAVIISEGRIYTAAPLNSPCVDQPTPTLTINGSLISINAGAPIAFCRKKLDNRTPAEIVNNEPKYLILLKNILSSPVQQWSEIAF